MSVTNLKSNHVFYYQGLKSQYFSTYIFRYTGVTYFVFWHYKSSYHTESGQYLSMP